MSKSAFFAILILLSSSALSYSPDDSIAVLYSQYRIGGLAACAFQGDSLIWEGYFGVRNPFHEDSLVTNATQFYLWSVTKPVNAIAFMQLWEQGLVELDGDISDYLPFEVCNPHYPEIPITPRMVMAHTSSLRANNLFFDGELEAGDTTYSNTAYVQQVYVPGGIWYDETMNFYNEPPGTSHKYNMHRSQAVLAAIVEQQSSFSDSFDLHCREVIFDPLGMEHTSYILGSVDTMGLAVPLFYQGGQWTAPYGYASAASYSGWLLKSSVMELANIVLAMMQGGELGGVRILEQATVDTMLTVQFPELNGDWGLGWRRMDNFQQTGRTIWGHYGNSGPGNDGGKAAMYFCPAENSAVVFLSNYCSDHVMNTVMRVLFDYVAEQTGMEGGSLPPCALIRSVAPNPFPATTTITIALPAPGPVQLDVFDLAGRHVSALLNQPLPAGNHTATFDGSELPPGVYLVRLRVPGSVSTAKCLITR